MGREICGTGDGLERLYHATAYLRHLPRDARDARNPGNAVMPRRAGLRVLAGSAVLAIGAAMVTPAARAVSAGAAPLHDSSCPTNPYAYLTPPSGAARLTPSTATSRLPVSGGSVAGAELSTGEDPPQAALTTMTGSILPPAGATSVTLTITPVAAPAVLPGGGRVDGNFYRYTAVGGNGMAATTSSSRPMTVQLRPTRSGARETVERFDGTRWTALHTSVGTGCGTPMAAPTGALGTFVLVAPAATPAGSTATTVPLWVPVLGVAVGVFGLVLVLLAIRPVSGVRPGSPRRPAAPPPA